jgi:HEAT repeat protein/beta-lactamase regulating signal transducer with metallopeptidase domain
VNLIELVGWSLVHSLWQGLAIALGLFILLRVLDLRRSALRYLVSVCALLLLVALPPITAAHSRGADPGSAPLTADENRVTSTIPALNKSAVDGSAGESMVPPTALKQSVEESARLNVTALHRRLLERVRPLAESAFPWLVVAWMVGVMILSLRLLGAWLRARHLRVDGTAAVTPAFQDVLDRVVAKLGVVRPVRLLQTSILLVPAVIGWIRPVVLIPATLVNGLTLAQLEAILAHELAHIRRHDFLVNLLQAVVETLMFYHPAMWWISRQARQEREHCCDDVAIRVCGDRKLYAGALLTLENHRAMGLLPAATGGDLLARVRRIAAIRLTHAETTPRWLAAMVAFAVVALGTGAVFLAPEKGNLAAQDSPRIAPPFADRNAPALPDTVIRHPDPSAPLSSRWDWSRQVATSQQFKAFWVGYTIEPMPGVEGSIYIGRLERNGISGEGLSLRGRITNFGNFTGFNVPGVMLSPLVGGGMPDDVALLFAYVVDNRNRPVLARVHVSSLALPVDLENRPLLWLGNSNDEESIAMVRSLYDGAADELKEDVVAALGVHGSRAAIPHLARWLEGTEDNDVREEAAEWLGRHPDPEALHVLTRAARNDRISDVRREAAEAVAEMRFPAATDSLIELARELRDTDARREAIEGLAEKPEERAMAAAADIARNDPSSDLRREAVETLGEFPDRAGVSQLIKLARTDPSADIRTEAVETLGEAAQPEVATQVLREIIEEDENEDVAREAVETLGEINDPAVTVVLRDLARTHRRTDVRREAIQTLAELDSGTETVRVLSQIAREDNNEDVQDEALESLGQLGDPEASKIVVEVARQHASADSRRRAVEMLVESMGPEAALPELTSIARNDPNLEVQVQATETLGELSPGLALPALRELVESHPREEVRVEALETLGDLATPEALEILQRLAEDSRVPSELRREAIEAISEQGNSERVLSLLARIVRANDDLDVQLQAVENIGEYGGESGITLLEDVARSHQNPEVRSEAIETLAEMNPPGVADILATAATTDGSDDVQEAAVEGLAELEDGGGVDALIQIARSHPNRDLRSRALNALSESDSPRARAAIDRMLQ